MPTLIGTAEAGTVVKLYDGARYLGTATAGSNGSYSITTSANLANGQHAFDVTATDAAGNVSAASTALTVTIDTVSPTRSAAPTLASGSDTGTSPTDGITNKATPTLTGTAEAGSTVTLYEGSAVLGTAVATDGTYTIASPTLRDGTHALTITATDTAGNVSAPSLTRNVTIDTSAPGVAISSTGGTVTRGAQTITGTGEAGTSITLTDNGNAIGTALVGNDGNWTQAHHPVVGQQQHCRQGHGRCWQYRDEPSSQLRLHGRLRRADVEHAQHDPGNVDNDAIGVGCDDTFAAKRARRDAFGGSARLTTQSGRFLPRNGRKRPIRFRPG